MAPGPLDFLTATNQWLEKVPLTYIEALENMVGNAETAVQSKVDQICVWLSWKVNIAIERKRQAIIKILYEQYQSTMMGKVMKTAMAVKSFLSNPLGAIGSFASAIAAPIAAVLSWISILMVEIPKLAENLAKIASALPPTPPNPNINYDKFKVKVGSISMGMITSDPSSLPPPEVMFPEPPKPFSKQTFDKSFQSEAKLKSNSVIYKLPDSEAQSLQELIAKETKVEFDDTGIL